MRAPSSPARALGRQKLENIDRKTGAGRAVLLAALCSKSIGPRFASAGARTRGRTSNLSIMI
jgi:hypothetical protein